MKTKDIREMSEAEIEKQLRDTRDERVLLRMQKQTGQVEHPHRFKEMNRQIARLEVTIHKQIRVKR